MGVAITVEVTYDMSKVLGTQRFEVQDARTVDDVIAAARDRFGDGRAEFDRLTRTTAIAVNGVLMNYRKGRKTPVAAGDTVTFVKAAAGG